MRVNGRFSNDLIAIDATSIEVPLSFVESNKGVCYHITSIEDVYGSGVRLVSQFEISGGLSRHLPRGRSGR